MKAVGRYGGKAVGCAVVLLTAFPPYRLTAQRVSAGAQGVIADYRETTASLHYRGTGFAGSASFAYSKFSADVAVASVAYEPEADGTGVEKFDALQIDARARYYVASAVSVEVGFTRRSMDPEFAAQSMRAARVGARASHLIGPGVSVSLRANYLAAARFSGGGKAPFGIEVGLGLSVGPWGGPLRLTADYDFQRLNRKTDDGSGELDVPIQQSLARAGVGVTF